MTSGSEQAHCTNLREESDPEIHQQVQRHFSEDTRDGGRTQGSSGTVLLSRWGLIICLPSFTHAAGNTTESPF